MAIFKSYVKLPEGQSKIPVSCWQQPSSQSISIHVCSLCPYGLSKVAGYKHALRKWSVTNSWTQNSPCGVPAFKSHPRGSVQRLEPQHLEKKCVNLQWMRKRPPQKIEPLPEETSSITIITSSKLIFLCVLEYTKVKSWLVLTSDWGRLLDAISDGGNHEMRL